MGKIKKGADFLKKTIDKLKDEKAARRKRRIERYGETGADAVEMGHLAAFVETAGALDYRQRKKEKKAKQGKKNKKYTPSNRAAIKGFGIEKK